MPRHTLTLILAGLVGLCPAAEPWSAELDAKAPAIKPELLVHSLLGGVGDQRFVAAQTKKGVSIATDGQGLSISVTIKPGEAPKVVASGNKNQPPPKKEPPGLLSEQGGKVGSISYGFKQVNPILQQPWAKGAGWTLWDFSYAQAKGLELMADSRIMGGLAMPNGNALLIGWCDGGNTVLHRDPRNITTDSPYMRYKFGGGHGCSTLFSELTPKGEVLLQAFLGAGPGAVVWDPWGRMYVCGTNLCAGGQAPLHIDSSGSLVVFGRDWTTTPIDVRLGGPGTGWADNMWSAMDLDPASGLLVLAGHSKQALAKPVSEAQAGHGGGTDAMIAVIRLWSPADYEAATARPAAPKPAP